MSDSPIETDRLIFRRFDAEDGNLLVDLDSDPEVMRYLTGGAATPRAVVERDVLPRMLRESDEPGFGFWALFETDSSEFVGWASLRKRGDSDAELGYRLKRAAWGRGFGTEAARALIRTGFMELGLQRIVANTYEANLASRRVMEKLGLRHVRSFQITAEDLEHTGTFDVASTQLWDGEDVEYAIERAEWQP
jgi:RimJ/RimL family protein N-acetyltransferase